MYILLFYVTAADWIFRETTVIMEDLDRNTAKFYDKIHPSLQQLYQSSSKDRSRTFNAGNNSVSKDGKTFGQITKEEMTNILKAYETQQNDPNLSNKPVTCDENVIKGGSYSKMLYAKTGFHYLGSTDYLIKELGIDDDNRWSFLGDLNRFTVSNTEDLKGLQKKYLNATIKKIIEMAYDQMNSQQMEKAKETIKKALELDRESGTAKLAKGIHHERSKQYDEAVREFRETLKCEDIDVRQVNLHLSEALTSVGMAFYHRRQWADSARLMEESIRANPENANARFHLEVCQQKLIREDPRRSYAFKPPQQGYRR